MHRLRIRILRILKVPKIHEFFIHFKTVNFKIHKIQIITFIAALLQSLRIACNFTLLTSVRIGVLNCRLFPFNGCLSVVD